MMRKFLSLGVAALAALLGGCGDGPSTVPGGYRSAATWSTFFAATASGPLLLEVHGNPFGGGKAELRDAVARAMSAAIPARPFTMTLDVQASASPKVRVVVVLGAPPSLDAAELCAGKVATAALRSEGGRVEVLAAFCDGGALLASVRGWVGRVEAADDARFVRLLGQVMRELAGDPPP
ncbi:hypothetical protein [Paramagnetospirillum magneticum]|uniref:DUF4136 domain-containing protein n=1 Tax=Paramagnetospirillum magneticum (strain ATCC 700264 / AMB-1) TaxID=342108 RepID=Q2W9W1_PARM1|nr:hypothetical protein [Paramagnetospirillum magneticum]BAE49364.1 hypothetical protein amb0560 [Paramagnetospirillum magneticum AMB-1]